MEIRLDNLGKRYRKEWIFKHLSFSFEGGKSYAIAGNNGAGKSTLMKILTGLLSPTVGEISYNYRGKQLDPSLIYRHIAFAAPYMELIEELTLVELVKFQQGFKAFQQNLQSEHIIELTQLGAAKNKPIAAFSSGMKQRLKLALAICADTPLLFLDEPSTNLDAQAIAWYHKMLDSFAKSRTLIIASNVDSDFMAGSIVLDMRQYKINRP